MLDLLVQRRRDKATAVKLMRKLLKKQGYVPEVLVTNKLRSYEAARAATGMTAQHEQGCEPTTVPRTRISHCEDGRGRCSDSSRDRHSASSPFTLPSTTPSSSSVI